MSERKREERDRKLNEGYFVAAKYPIEAISEPLLPRVTSVKSPLSRCGDFASSYGPSKRILPLRVVSPPRHIIVGVIIARDTCQSSASVVHFRQAWPRGQASDHNGQSRGGGDTPWRHVSPAFRSPFVLPATKRRNDRTHADDDRARVIAPMREHVTPLDRAARRSSARRSV